MSYAIALAGILMSGVVATLATYYLNTTKEQTFYMRRKAEELYLAFELYDRSLSGYYLPAYGLVKGKISWNDFNNLVIKNADEKQREASRQVIMLVDIYFPNVRGFFEQYSKQRDTLNSILSDHKRAYEAGDAATKFFKPFHDAMGRLCHSGEEVKSAIIVEGRRFANNDQLWPWRLDRWAK
jgi:hypothetical protein